MTAASAKSKWNAKVEAHKLLGSISGLITSFEANGLDPGPLKKAAKALEPVTAEVEEVNAAARKKGAVVPDEMEQLRRENEELKARLVTQPNR